MGAHPLHPIRGSGTLSPRGVMEGDGTGCPHPLPAPQGRFPWELWPAQLRRHEWLFLLRKDQRLPFAHPAPGAAAGAQGQPRLGGVPCCLPTWRPLHRGPVLVPVPRGPVATSREAGAGLGATRSGGHTDAAAEGLRGEHTCVHARAWGAHVCACTCAGSTSSRVCRGSAGTGSLARVRWDPGPAQHRAQPHGPAPCPVPMTGAGDGKPGPVPQIRLTQCPGGAISVPVLPEGWRGGGSGTAPVRHLWGSVLDGAAQTGSEPLPRPGLSGETLGHGHSQAWPRKGTGDSWGGPSPQ